MTTTDPTRTPALTCCGEVEVRRSGEWICVARASHPDGQHYRVKRYQACKSCNEGAYVCVHDHADDLGPRLHCRSSFSHDQLLLEVRP